MSVEKGREVDDVQVLLVQLTIVEFLLDMDGCFSALYGVLLLLDEIEVSVRDGHTLDNFQVFFHR